MNFSLLPIELSNAAANITAALVLKTEAGLGVEVGAVEAEAKVGAHLSLVEVTLGGVIDNGDDAACQKSLFVGIECNAGAFAQAGASVPGHEFEVGPEVSTVFASAGTSTCLGTKSPAFSSTRSADPLTASDVAACPTALVTDATDVTRTYSMTSCVVPAVNCPQSLTQVVVVTHVEEGTTVRCPVDATALPTDTDTTSTAASDVTPIPATPPPTAVVPATFFSQSAISVAPLTVLVTSSLPPSFANATAPVNATVAGVFETISVPPPPPTAGVNVGDHKDDDNAAAGLQVPAYGGAVAALVGVALGMMVML